MHIGLPFSTHSATAADAGRTLAEDLHTVIADVQSLLQATASQSSEGLDEIRSNIARSIESAKQRLLENEAMLVAQSKATLKATDIYVHGHPWQSAGMAAALGFAMGVGLALALKR